MDSLVARWKNTVDSQKLRHKKKAKGKKKEEDEEPQEDYVKTQAQRVVDALSNKDSEPPSCKCYLVSKFRSVCNIIEEIISKERNQHQLSKDKEETSKHRTESTNRVISDLESRLFEAEREKVS